MPAFCSCCGAEITLKAETCAACGAPRHGMLPSDRKPPLDTGDDAPREGEIVRGKRPPNRL